MTTTLPGPGPVVTLADEADDDQIAADAESEAAAANAMAAKLRAAQAQSALPITNTPPGAQITNTPTSLSEQLAAFEGSGSAAKPGMVDLLTTAIKDGVTLLPPPSVADVFRSQNAMVEALEIYIDCAPRKPTPRDVIMLEDWIQPYTKATNAHALSTFKVPDWRLLDHGKGKGLLAAYIAQAPRPVGTLLVSSRTPGADVAMEHLIPFATRVVGA